MFCPMSPPIEDSVVKLGKNRWLLGPSVVCEAVSRFPKEMLESWECEDGKTYCLRKLSRKEKTVDGLRDCGSSESDRVHHAGTSAAVWAFGSVFVKVKAWRPGMQLESDTIRYINSISSVPTPEVIYSWIDTDWHRSFLILRSLKGRTLHQSWNMLSVEQRGQVATSVAHFCSTLARSTSDRLETTDGKGIVEPFLTAQPPDSEPSWKPQLLGPFSLYQLRSFLSEPLITEDFQEEFCLYHADLGPTNILVTENGDLVGIIDWESAAFYPRFWLGTKPLVSAGFFLEGSGAKRRAWAILLADALEREGLAPDMNLYQAWKKAVGR